MAKFVTLGAFSFYGDPLHFAYNIHDKHILFDLFRPILLAIKDDEDVQKFIKLRSENAGMPYFTKLNYLCKECNNSGVRGYLPSICRSKF